MAEVTWIKGTIDPPQSGEYYVALEAKRDIINPVTGTVDYKTGDVMSGADVLPYHYEVTFYPQMFVDGVVDFEIGD